MIKFERQAEGFYDVLYEGDLVGRMIKQEGQGERVMGIWVHSRDTWTYTELGLEPQKLPGTFNQAKRSVRKRIRGSVGCGCLHGGPR